MTTAAQQCNVRRVLHFYVNFASAHGTGVHKPRIAAFLYVVRSYCGKMSMKSLNVTTKYMILLCVLLNFRMIAKIGFIIH